MRVVISHLSTCLFQIIFSTDRFIYLYYLKIIHSCTEVDDAVVGYTLGGILGFLYMHRTCVMRWRITAVSATFQERKWCAVCASPFPIQSSKYETAWGRYSYARQSTVSYQPRGLVNVPEESFPGKERQIDAVMGLMIKQHLQIPDHLRPLPALHSRLCHKEAEKRYRLWTPDMGVCMAPLI